MDHLNFAIMIQEHIDGCLPEELRPALEEHLAACPQCRQMQRELTSLDGLLAAELTHVAPPADFAASVMQALPATYAAPAPVVKRRPRWQAWASVAVAAMLLLAAGLSGLLEPGPGQPLDPPPLADNADNEDQNSDDPQLLLPQLPIVADNPDPVTEPADPAQTDPADPAEQPRDPEPGATQDPEPSGATQPPAPDPGASLNLPAVATTSQASGAYAMITLASVTGCDALRPQVSNNIVTFYIQHDGFYLEWQVASDGSGQAVFAGQSESLPALSGAGRYESDEAGLEWYAASSPDGVYTAHNRADGLYINDRLMANVGGGYLVHWAADSSKLFFSDAAGRLWLYYPAENLLLDILGGVSSAVWSGNNNIVLSAYDGSTGFYSVFRVTVP